MLHPMITLDEWARFFVENSVSKKQSEILLDYVDGLNLGGFPVIFEFEHLSKILGINAAVLAQIVANSEKSYRTFSIPKRKGGVRSISSPYPALESCQRWILQNILSHVDLGDHSYAFRKDRSILDNARLHAGNQEMLKIDLLDFFSSVELKRVISVFKCAGYTNLLSYHLASICCLNNCLPQGACTSPALSNIIAKRLDLRLFALASKLNLKYSRYADDITLSGNHVPKNIMSTIRRIVEDEGFKINEGKTIFKAKNQKKIVTGLCVTGDVVRVPKEFRRNFRKNAYFFIKNGMQIYRSDDGKFDPLYIYRLIGQANFILFIEPMNEYAKSALRDLKLMLPRHGENT